MRCSEHIRRYTAAFLSAVMLAAPCMDSDAAYVSGTDTTAWYEKQQTALEVTHEAGDVINAQLDEVHSRLDEMILENGYDYELTWECLNEKGDPAAAFDYTGMLSAYMACREHLGTSRTAAFSDIEAWKLSVTPCVLEETVPMRVQEYTLLPDGTYEKAGTRFITEPESIPSYEEGPDGRWVCIGEETAVPERLSTPYADAVIEPCTPEDVFGQMGVDAGGEVWARYEQLKGRLEELVTNEGIYTNGGRMLTKEEVLSAEMDAFIQEALKKIRAAVEQQKKEDAEKEARTQAELWAAPNAARGGIVEAGLSLVGKVPYLWGGKARKAGYDETWWTVRGDGKANGLDCSGFVQWAYRTAGFPEEVWSGLSTTKSILTCCTTVAKEDLMPGDIGLLNNGDGINHCGIYIGDGQFVHCSSGKGTVTVSAFPFTVFKRVQINNIKNIDIKDVALYNDIVYKQNNANIGTDDVLLTAKLIMSEAAGEGFNGMAAVAQVVKNRVDSPQFPDNVHDVIYQEGSDGVLQFSDNSRIEAMEPTKEALAAAAAVLSGKLDVLGDRSVLFYRRPPEGSEYDDWGRYPYSQRIGHHTFYRTDES